MTEQTELYEQLVRVIVTEEPPAPDGPQTPYAILKKLLTERREAFDEVEQLRVKLGGCLLAAEGQLVSVSKVHPGDYGWSPALERTRELRQGYEGLRQAHEHVTGKPCSRGG